MLVFLIMKSCAIIWLHDYVYNRLAGFICGIDSCGFLRKPNSMVKISLVMNECHFYILYIYIIMSATQSGCGQSLG